MKKRAFTLIELLAVILIISILLGLLTAAIRRSYHSAQEQRVTSDKQTLVAAFKAYRHEYGRWPLAVGDKDSISGIKQYKDNNADVIKTLSLNTDNIRFLSIGDYQLSSSNKAVLNALTLVPFNFKFDLNNDTCDVQ